MGVTDEAIRRIKDLIAGGALRPGQRLPPEKTLAGELGLSRTSLREAVRALTLINVLDTKQGDGTYVSSLQPADLLGVVAFAVDLLGDRELMDLFEVRRLLEPAATGLAATRMTDETLVELEALLDRIDAADDWEQLVAIDLGFHQRIVDSTGNEMLASLQRNLSHRTTRARMWRGIVVAGTQQVTRRQHYMILAALRHRDSAAAQAAASVHVADGEEWLRTYYEHTGDEPGAAAGG